MAEYKKASYGGRAYDSLTEARWAAYFDIAGIEAIPQPACYATRDLNGNLDYYIPDFYLPEDNTIVEVKNGNACWGACNRLARLVRATGMFGLLVDGSPRNISMYRFCPSSRKLPDPGSAWPYIGFADSYVYRRMFFVPHIGGYTSRHAEYVISNLEHATNIADKVPCAEELEAHRKHREEILGRPVVVESPSH